MSDLTQINGSNQQEQSSVFNLRDIISKYGKYLPLIAFFLLVGFILSYLKIRYATPVYEIKSSILIKNEKKYSSNENEKFMDLFLSGDDQNVNNEREILKSRPLVGRVVSSLNLQISYYNKGRIRTSLLYGNIPFTLEIIKLTDSLSNFALNINGVNESGFKIGDNKNVYFYNQPFETRSGKFKIVQTKDVLLTDFGSDEFIISYNSFPSAVENIVSNIKVQRAADYANILDISLLNENPLLGKDIVDRLMKEYAISNIEDKNKIAFNTLRFIDDRLNNLGDELGGVETNLQTFREKNQAIDLEQQSGVYFDNLKSSEDLLQGQAIKVQILEYLINYIQHSENIYKIVPSNLGIEEPTLVPLFGEYNSKILERESLLKITPEKNIIIQDLNTQIAKLRLDILENLKNVKESYLITKRDLEKRYGQIKSQVQNVPKKAKGLLEITRQQKIKEELFLFLLQKKEETAISSASTISSSKVVEPAIPSSGPVKPNRLPTYLSYELIALACAVLIIVIIELLNDKVKSRKDIERNTNAPILGQIGHSLTKDNALIVSKNSRSVIAEQFRILRTSLQYVLKTTEKPVILISSTFSGEGKSFVATNLGAAIALTGKKTVILEFDIRKPKILAGLNIKSNVGITNFIVGSSSLENIIIPVNEVENLYVIPCGPIPPNPSELLLDEKISTLIAYCKENFDTVIVDTAPAGLVSDALILSKFGSCCLYIVRQRYTYLRQIEFVDELYRNQKLKSLALVINDVKSDSIMGYGYGGYGSGYGYGYGYGNKGYYEDNRSNKGVIRKFQSIFKRGKQ